MRFEKLIELDELPEQADTKWKYQQFLKFLIANQNAEC